MTKAGFATIIGRPNVGKSTLMNTLIGQKIAITSYKPQTTRNQIRTIYTDDNGQIVFLDTPGMYGISKAAENRFDDYLGEYMYRAAQSTLREVDVILWLTEPKLPIKEEDRALMKVIAEAAAKTPVILVISKADTVKKAELLPVIEAYAGEWTSLTGRPAPEILPVSARTKMGIEDLKDAIFSSLPEGEPYYDTEQVTTETERQIAQEMIREKALRLLQDEVPHGIAVQITKMKYRKRKGGALICDIEGDVICERESHKAIVIGAGADMIRKIGTAARKDIENMLDTKVNLKLFVKVRKEWKDNDNVLKSFGYDRKAVRKL